MSNRRRPDNWATIRRYDTVNIETRTGTAYVAVDNVTVNADSTITLTDLSGEQHHQRDRGKLRLSERRLTWPLRDAGILPQRSPWRVSLVVASTSDEHPYLDVEHDETRYALSVGTGPTTIRSGGSYYGYDPETEQLHDLPSGYVVSDPVIGGIIALARTAAPLHDDHREVLTGIAGWVNDHPDTVTDPQGHRR